MPKDILVLMTDQHRADWVGSFGGSWVRTPSLDRLASDGIRFTECMTSSPLCMPARASFLTGMYPHNFGMWENAGRVRETCDTYLHSLRAAGYRTCHVGKSHLHPHGSGRDLRDAQPYMRALGWDDVLECTGPLSTQNTKSILTEWMEQQGTYQTFLDDYRKRREDGRGLGLWPSPLPEGKHMDDFMADTAVDYINSSEASQPLFLFVGLGGPHNPWDPPGSFDTYQPEDMPEPLQWDSAPEWLSGAAGEYNERMMGHNHDITLDKWLRLRSLYSGRVEHVDSLMGRVLEAWEKRRGRDSWVLFWSDHGEMAGDKSRIAKGVFYRSSLRVPVILRPPDGGSGPLECGGLVSTPDLTATLLDMAECEPAGRNMFGRSLLPALDDPNSVGSDVVISEVYGNTMIFDGRWKMVVNGEAELLTLHDTESDPDETLNLAGRPDTAQTADRLRSQLLDFLLRTADNQYREVNA